VGCAQRRMLIHFGVERERERERERSREK